MIPVGCKRLAEVDFPIAAVSKHAAREKSIRHGHPSTLQLWWARRPLASSRAVLLTLLWPDPCDPLCPTEFKEEARKRLGQVPNCNPGVTNEDLRHALLRFIADFSNWDNAAQRTYLEVSRALVKAAHMPKDDSAYEPPLVVDPFAGGGSIPLEALRLGCDAFASDLNPVACQILKVMLEDIPRNGIGLAEELHVICEDINREASMALERFYPPDPDGARPLLYLWARTVTCESPHCGVEFPIVRTRWLSKRSGSKRALAFETLRDPNGAPKAIRVEVFTPASDDDVGKATASRGKAICPACNTPMLAPRLQQVFRSVRGGTNPIFDSAYKRTGGARLLAVLVRPANSDDRHYRSATERDYEGVMNADALMQTLPPETFPHETINPVRPSPNARGLSAVTRYGMTRFSDLYATRQLIALGWLTAEIRRRADTPVHRLLVSVLARCVDYWNSAATWASSGEFVAHAFGRQALPMVWDFVEVVPYEEGSGSLPSAMEWVARVIEATAVIPGAGQVEQADAINIPLPDDSASIWFTDPPYYDSVPYADLSDFFFVWIRRALPTLSVVRFSDHQGLTPKIEECVWNQSYDVDGKAKDGKFFEAKAALAFGEGARIAKHDAIGCVVFAHKSTEGWEALLSGMIEGGWELRASWPVATERPGRLLSKDSAALATSVHLVCRRRKENAPIGDWAGVLRDLPRRVGDWMERLQHEGVRGADLVFACIGPALEIFSRYTKVETAEGREVKLDEYLAKVWEVVGRSALAQVLGSSEATARNGAAGAVEEDARLTALFLWTLQSTNSEAAEAAGEADEDDDATNDAEDEEGGGPSKAKGFSLIFDVVRRFAQPLGIDLPRWEARVIETKKGVVRLLPIAERAKQLFGEDGAQAVATRLEQETALGTNPLQGMLFPEIETAPKIRGRAAQRSGGRARARVSDESLASAREATTLDRVHAAMLLQAGGRTNALRALLKAEQDRGTDFLRLANALSALYPKGSEEKRLLDAMLLAVPR